MSPMGQKRTIAAAKLLRREVIHPCLAGGLQHIRLFRINALHVQTHIGLCKLRWAELSL